MRVALFVTCLADLVAPEVGVATARVLQRAGHEVIFPEGQTCCGQPAFNSGHRAEAAKVLRSTLRALAGARADAYVAPTPAHVASIGGIQNFASNLAGVLGATTTGVLIAAAGGSYVTALVLSGGLSLVGAFSYLVIVGRVEPLPVDP